MITRASFYKDLFGNPKWPLFDDTKISRPGDQEERLGAFILETSSKDVSEDRDHMVENNAKELTRVLFHSRTLSSYRTFLFVADGSWQPNNRIVKYKKLWQGFEKNWGVDTFAPLSAEVEFESDEGLRYAGLLEVNETNITVAVELVRSRETTGTSCALIASKQLTLDSETDIRNIFSSAFAPYRGNSDTHIDWANLSAMLCPSGDVVGRVTGVHDDPFVETQLFSMEALISNLAEETNAHADR